jgi:hypothetical protein
MRSIPYSAPTPTAALFKTTPSAEHALRPQIELTIYSHNWKVVDDELEAGDDE